MEIARHWRLKQQRYSLVGEVCPHCDNKIFPPRDLCPNCGQEARDTFIFSGKGNVYASTELYNAPTGFDSNTPYVIALVRLKEGPLVTAQLTDLDLNKNGQYEKPEIGTPVEMVTRKMKDDGDERGVIIYGYKFRPAMDSS